MTLSNEREMMVLTLLDALAAERHIREPLLRTLADELASIAGLERAADSARRMLAGMQAGELPPSDFAARVRDLRSLVHGLAA